MTTKTDTRIPSENEIETVNYTELDGVTGGCNCGAAGCSGSQPQQQQQLGGLWRLAASLRR